MALSTDELATLRRLNARLNADVRGRPGMPGFLSLDAYYDGAQRLAQLGLAIPDDLRQFVTIVAWPGIQVDAIEERVDVEGFRLPGQPEADTGLSEVWQGNDLDVESQMAHTDALVFGRAYGCVGTNDDDPDLPLVTVESPLEMVHEWSPRKRSVETAGRFYVDDSTGTKVRRSTLYLSDATVWCQMGRNGWEEEDRDQHELGRVPVVPLVNRGRLHKRFGLSEMGRIIGLTDAAARALTLAQVATEVMGIPQRTAAGMTQADFTDAKTGEMLTQWEAYFGAVWATKNPDAKFHQFSAAELSNFANIVNLYGQLVAGITGLPLRYFGQATTNPPSADGIRADEARLVKRCERFSRAVGGGWESLMILVRRFQTGEDDSSLANMETLFRDPATPTRAQTADAAVKLFAAGITSKRQTRRDVGYSSVQIANMERDDEQADVDPITNALLRGLNRPDDDEGTAGVPARV